MYSIGVDIGGTFTDCVLVDAAGRHVTSKALSTPADPAAGVLDALAVLASAAGTTLPELLAGTTRFAHGTTIGTNAVLERRGARVGLVATAGHGDALMLMRGHGRVAGRSIEDVFSVHGSALPAPLTTAVLELHERVDARGEVVVALDVARAVGEVVDLVRTHDLDAVAIALLWSFANPDHERKLAAELAAALPQLYLSRSSEVSPRLGEYERTVATVINGYVGPACSSYLVALADRLAEAGLRSPLLVMQSNGGVLPARAAAATSLGTIDSGPAGGLTGVAALASAHGHDRVVATDMGGTSFDIGVVVDGKPVVAEENVIDQYTYRLPHLDVRTIACGGGTVARYDQATGSLRVGPRSAGAEPGPACYGRGGTEPTVTDADVVLGLLRPEAFLGGRMPLDRDAAVAAVQRLATRLGLSVEDTAAGILEINNMRAASLVRQQTIERGHDPRDFVLYAYGGAGPVHAFGYAAEIGVREVVIPLGNGASTLSAYGIAAGDAVRYRELERTFLAPFDPDLLPAAVAVIEASARADLAAAGVNGDVKVEVEALMRFREQLMHSLEIPVALPAGPDTGPQLLAAFNAEYERRYGAGGTALFQAVEIFALRARASVAANLPTPQASPAAGNAPQSTGVYWPGLGRTATAVHVGVPADAVRGPALVELEHTTIAVPPGATLRPDRDALTLTLKES